MARCKSAMSFGSRGPSRVARVRGSRRTRPLFLLRYIWICIRLFQTARTHSSCYFTYHRKGSGLHALSNTFNAHSTIPATIISEPEDLHYFAAFITYMHSIHDPSKRLQDLIKSSSGLYLKRISTSQSRDPQSYTPMFPIQYEHSRRRGVGEEEYCSGGLQGRLEHPREGRSSKGTLRRTMCHAFLG